MNQLLKISLSLRYRAPDPVFGQTGSSSLNFVQQPPQQGGLPAHHMGQGPPKPQTPQFQLPQQVFPEMFYRRLSLLVSTTKPVFRS